MAGLGSALWPRGTHHAIRDVRRKLHYARCFRSKQSPWPALITTPTTSCTVQACDNHSASALPFGAVMATAGAAALTRPCGLGWLAIPLLTLAIAQAFWIAAVTLWPYRNAWQAFPKWLMAVHPPHEHSGTHTVPLGLAIIASVLAGLGVAGHQLCRTPWLSGIFLLLAWLTGAVCIGRFTLALTRHPWRLSHIDGTWFLLPAVPLGLAIASTDVVALAPASFHTTLVNLALLAGCAGWLGYWLLAIATAGRVARHGLGTMPRSPWWIVMGCAGLSASALGKVLHAATWPTMLHQLIALSVTIAACTALALLLPVLGLSLRFLLHDCRYRNTAAWPPTFSTAVFALGSLTAGATQGASGWHTLGLTGGYATLALWAVSFGWNLSRQLQRRA